MWFMDEKLFTVTPPVNLQNDRVYVAVQMRKKQVAANRLLRIRSNFSKFVMVSVGVLSLGCTELIFIDPGFKINGAYYRDVLLNEHLLSDIKELSDSEFLIFQQDSAPAHRARDIVDLLSRETPDFVAPTFWSQSGRLQDIKRPSRTCLSNPHTRR